MYLSGQLVHQTCRDDKLFIVLLADILLTSVQYCLVTTKGLLVEKLKINFSEQKPWYYTPNFSNITNPVLYSFFNRMFDTGTDVTYGFYHF